jgi:hypothetical protein
MTLKCERNVIWKKEWIIAINNIMNIYSEGMYGLETKHLRKYGDYCVPYATFFLN